MEIATFDPITPHAHGGPSRRFLPRTSMPPIWRELTSLVSWWSAPPAAAAATAPGRGEPVLLVPGFLAGDRSMLTVSDHLDSAGYHPHASGISSNVGCSETTLRHLSDRAERLADGYGQRVAIVGHSRGGVLGRVLALRRPDLVSGVVALGAPHRDHLAVHPIVWAHIMAVALLGRLGRPGTLSFSCGGGPCCRQFWDDLAAPLPDDVGWLCIYTRGDGIVDWRACVDPSGEHLEAVGATHCGLVTHPAALHATATALARFDARRALEAEPPALAFDLERIAA